MGCNQCSRMNIPCPGYPNPLEQSFRNQNAIVMRKAEAVYNRKARWETTSATDAPNPWSLIPSTESENPKPEAFLGELFYSPSLHLDTVAVTEFMASYVPQSPYDYLPTLYLNQTPKESIIVNVKAVSLAMAACKLKDPRILCIARQLYGSALSDLNEALRDPCTASQDSTLVSVLLLGLFEALACQLTGASNNWAQHTSGALALLRLRGGSQLSSELGRRLFDQICAISTFDAMVRKVHVSQDLLKLVSTAKMMHYGSPKTSFVKLIGEITESPCVLWDCTMDPLAKVTKALWLDQKVSQFIETLPLDFEYQRLQKNTHNTSESGWEVHGYTIHQYRHHHAARMWNACRVLRIRINVVIHRTSAQLPSSAISKPEEWKTDLRRAMINITDAANDVCASVPQILDPAKYDKVGIEASNEARVATLLPALSVLKAELLVPQTIRSYAADRLQLMGRKFRVSQATTAATTGIGLDVLHSGFHMLYVY